MGPVGARNKVVGFVVYIIDDIHISTNLIAPLEWSVSSILGLVVNVDKLCNSSISNILCILLCFIPIQGLAL